MKSPRLGGFYRQWLASQNAAAPLPFPVEGGRGTTRQETGPPFALPGLPPELAAAMQALFPSPGVLPAAMCIWPGPGAPGAAGCLFTVDFSLKLDNI